MPETLYIIDVSSILFQVFHAIPPMTGPKGQPTNAVFGFTRDLQFILREKQPTYLICAMDSAGPGVRTEIYAEYKANRAEMPDDLVPQIDMAREVMEAHGCLVIEHAGWEADDVIATATRQAVERGIDVRIVTGDKDARQLLGPQVQVYNVRKNACFDEARLVALEERLERFSRHHDPQGMSGRLAHVHETMRRAAGKVQHAASLSLHRRLTQDNREGAGRDEDNLVLTGVGVGRNAGPRWCFDSEYIIGATRLAGGDLLPHDVADLVHFVAVSRSNHERVMGIGRWRRDDHRRDHKRGYTPTGSFVWKAAHEGSFRPTCH
jgi:hypothetical protein